MFSNLFKTAHGYDEILERVAVWTGIETFVAALVLQVYVPAIGTAVRHTFLASVTLSISDVRVPLVALIVGYSFFLMSGITHLHDQISKVLGIRARFDTSKILRPLAAGAKAEVTTDQFGDLAKRRNKTVRSALMRRTFYSHLDKDPLKTEASHYITMAWQSWYWYWVLLEWILFAVATALVFAAFGVFAWAVGVGCVAVFFFLLLLFRGHRCAGAAQDEVNCIISDASREASIRQAFDEILGQRR